MRYESKLTEKGNSSYSYTSQAEADTRAKALDDSGCTGCTGCTGCAHCAHCTDCTDCTDEVIQAGQPNGWPCYGWLKDGALFIHCGCRRKTLAEARAYWANKPDRREVLAAVEYIATIAALRGWNLGE